MTSYECLAIALIQDIESIFNPECPLNFVVRRLQEYDGDAETWLSWVLALDERPSMLHRVSWGQHFKRCRPDYEGLYQHLVKAESLTMEDEGLWEELWAGTDSQRAGPCLVLWEDAQFKVYMDGALRDVTFTKDPSDEGEELSVAFDEYRSVLYVKQEGSVWELENDGEGFSESRVISIAKSLMSFDFRLFKVFRHYLYFELEGSVRVYNLLTQSFVGVPFRVEADNLDAAQQWPQTPVIVSDEGLHMVFSPEPLLKFSGCRDVKAMLNGRGTKKEGCWVDGEVTVITEHKTLKVLNRAGQETKFETESENQLLF